MTVKNPPKHIEEPTVCKLPPGKVLVRFYNPARVSWRTPRHHGPIRDQRFDHHPRPRKDHAVHSVWYAGATLNGAVAEAFGRDGIVDCNADTRVCVVELTSPFRVVDLVGDGARYIGLDQEIGTTTNSPVTRAWARELYRQVPKLVGIRWTGRQVGSENVVLNDRADLSTLNLLHDYQIGEPKVWPRIMAAAYECRLEIVL